MLKKVASLFLCIAMAAALGGCAQPSQPSAAPKSTAQPAASASVTPAQSAAPSASPKAAPVSADGETITVIDHNGDTVVLPKKIDRIVVCEIYPLPAMLSMYLGSAEKIVGMHSVSMAAAKNGILGKLYPEILKANTAWMSGSEINIEELIKLKPDVVFYSAPTKATGEAIRAAGIPAVGVHATKWEYDSIRTFDEWVSLLDQIFPGNDRVKGVSDYAKQVRDEIAEKTKGIPEAERKRAMFLFQYDETVMITSGKNFFGQYWVTSAGGINVAEGMSEQGSNAKIGMEQVYEWNPDTIYITNFTPAQPGDLYENKIAGDKWETVQAVKDQRVYKMPLGAYRTYTPGVDTPLTLKFMATTMYPELFADVDMVHEVKDYYKNFFDITLTDEDVTSMFNPSGAAGVPGFK